MLIVLDDMIADMKSNRKQRPISHWIVFNRKALSVSLVFISQS